MATKSPLEGSGREELLIGLATARTALRERVSQLRATVQKIEEDLSAELDRLEREHKEKLSEYKSKLSSLTAIRIVIEDQFKKGDFEDLKKSILSDTDKKIEALERDYPLHSVELVWKERVGDQLMGIGNVVVSVGRIEVKEREVKLDNYTVGPIPAVLEEPVEYIVDIPLVIPAKVTGYSLRTKPVETVKLPNCQYPQGIAYDYIDNAVYILGNTSYHLHSYSLVTKQVKQTLFPPIYLINGAALVSRVDTFRQNHIHIEYIRPQPYGIEFHENTLYISAITRNIITHDLINSLPLQSQGPTKYIDNNTGVFFGKHGSEEGEMNTPTGLAFSDPNLYVCDSKNNRINVYSNQCIVRTITDDYLHQPLDIKIHESSIFVLNSEPPYVIEFDLTGVRKKLLLFFHEKEFQPSFFCIDSSGRFLITDKRQPYVYVFNKHGITNRPGGQALQTRLELKHGEHRLVEPRGVCIDKKGRVIVVCSCNYKEAVLQIF